MRNADIEQRWIDSWNEFYDLIRGLERYEIMLPNQEIVDNDACLGFLQDAVYRGCCVGIRRYRRYDQRHPRRGEQFRIVVKVWPAEADVPHWEMISGSGFVLEE